MNTNLDARLADACAVLRASYERGWISTRDGNVSVASGAGDGAFRVSPSGVVKHRLEPDAFVRVDAALRFDDARGGPRPSGEIELHRRVQALLPAGHGTVLHLHATHIVAALYAGLSLNEVSAEFPEVARYTRVGADVPALAATSEELAEATERAFRAPLEMPHVVGLDRHGVVAIGRDPWDAFEHVERLEHICQIVLAASGARAARRVPRLDEARA